MTGLKLAVVCGRWLVAGEVAIGLTLVAAAVFGTVFQKQLEEKMENSAFRWDNLGADASFFAGMFGAGLALTLLLLIVVAGMGWALASYQSHPLHSYFAQTTLWSIAGLVLLVPGMWWAASLLRGGLLPH